MTSLDQISALEARIDLWQALDNGDGVTCPVCDQHAKIYRWSLYATAVRALELLYNISGTTGYTHVNELRPHGYSGHGDVSRLRRWELVEEGAGRRDDGGRTGLWRVTARGEAFLRGVIQVPKYALVYNNATLALYGDPVSVTDVLKRQAVFDLRSISRLGDAA